MKHGYTFIFVFLLLLFPVSYAPAFQAEQPERSILATDSSADTCSDHPNSKPLDTKTDLGRIIATEMLRLDTFFGFPSKVCENEGDGSEASRSGAIYLDVKELKEIQSKSEVKYFELLLRFVLAHERTHEFQFQKYPRSLWDTDRAAKLRVMECQADLYSAYVFGVLFDQDAYEKELAETREATGTYDPTINTDDPKDMQKLNRLLLERNPWNDIWYAAEGIGDPPAPESEHPTPAQRSISFETGFWLGQLSSAVAFWQSASAQQREKLLGAKEPGQWAEDIVREFGFSDIPTSIAPMQFLLDEARRITQYSDGSLAKVKFIDKVVAWPKTRDGNVVRYTVTMRNSSTRSIRVDTGIKLAYVARYSLDDIEPTELEQNRGYSLRDPENVEVFATKRLTATLKPKESRDITVRFTFIRRYQEEWMPVLIGPADDTALITTHYVHTTEKDNKIAVH